MSKKNERIIPITLEYDDDSTKEEDKNIASPAEDSRTESGLPIFNVKEKIIIVVDIGRDSNTTDFHVNADKYSPFEMLKQSIEFFLNFKHSINSQHEYALVLIKENTIVWQLDFTSRIDRFFNALNKVAECDEVEDIIDFNQLFEIIQDKVKVPEICKDENSILPPQYLVRAIIFYARSYTLPVLKRTKEIEELLSTPLFIVDILMTHEPIDTNNKAQKIFNILQNIDKKGFSYCFSVQRDARTLRRSTAKLLGHPLQRSIENMANYSTRTLNVAV